MEETSLTKRVGMTLRRLRLATGMSQEAFADHCGLHRTYIGSIERGEKTITIETANKLACALGLSLSQLFQQVEKERTAQDGGHRG
jgi:transcriptional regulator with XRE-family HTH domain